MAGTPASHRAPLWILLALSATAVSLGVWLRLSLLDVGSLWIDELWTLDAVSRSFKEMVGARLVSDQSPPLFTVLAWLWLRVVGTYDAAAMRLLPLTLGVVAVIAPLFAAVRLRSLRPALLVMASVSALSLFSLQYSVELRAYSTMIGLGTIATVIWAGLMVGDLPPSGRWIFAFTLFGALAGVAHYYGNLPYVVELVLLAAAWRRIQPRQSLALLGGWGALSLVPVVAWFVLTQRWFPNHAVAPPPSIAEINSWAEYALTPLANLLREQPPSYFTAIAGLGGVILVAIALLIGAAALAGRLRGADGWDVSPSARIGWNAAIVVLVSLALAWIASVVRPPSMNVRNLAALLPPLFLAVGAAATLGRPGRTDRQTGAAVVALWVVATLILVGRFGVASVAPPWHIEAGYGATVRTVLASPDEVPAPALIGLEMPWAWHGQWDAALRAELGASPAESEDPPPVAVRWILNVEELRATGLPDAPLIVFTDASDERSAALFAWLQEARAGCQPEVMGGPGYGVVSVVRCPASR
jgi:hypothetical protein